MFTKMLSGGLLGAVVGLAMLGTGTSASAFTTPSPAIEQSAAGAPIEQIWYDRWGNWHPNGWGPYWGPGPYYPGWHRVCWWGPFGHRHCRWVR